MRKLSVAMLFAAISVTVSTNAVAQAQLATPSYPMQELRDSLLKGVTLADSQKIKVESIARGYWEVMRASNTRMSELPRDSQRVFMRELRDKQVGDLRKVLTPVQQKQFDENRKIARPTP